MKLIYNVNDRPKFGQLIVFAIQQLLAIMAATLVVPIIVGNDMQPAAALFGAGVGTLVYVLFTKGKSPVFLGSSFAFLGSMAAAFAGGVSMQLGYLGLIIGAIFAGLVYVIIALIVKAVGVNWINKLMPAVVIGPTVAIIGLSLAGNAIGDLTKTNYITAHDVNDYQVVAIDATDYSVTKDENDEEKQIYTLGKDGDVLEYVVIEKDIDITSPIHSDNIRSDITANPIVDEKTKEITGFELTSNYGSTFVAIICGLITLAVTILCATFGKKMVRLIPFVIGICAGYLAATIFFFIGKATGTPALMIIDFSRLEALFNNGITINSFISIPEFTLITALGGFKEITGTYIATIAVAYVPVAFVVFAEHIADHKNISTIIEKDLLEDPGLSRTLLGDGVGSMVGALFGGCPNTTYGESVGCVAITGNASVITIITAAIGAMVISFIAPFVAFVNTIPSCVMGGICMALYGFIAVSGLKMIQKVDLEKNRNLFVVSVILIAGIGGLSLKFGQVTITSIACALILGILANTMLSKAEQ